jgi:hypothetical protein
MESAASILLSKQTLAYHIIEIKGNAFSRRFWPKFDLNETEVQEAFDFTITLPKGD